MIFGNKHVETKKRIPNLRNKTKYITHYKNLKLYVSLGMRVTKIHRAVSFLQEAWMKPFIHFNTVKRQEAKSDFLKSLFKLTNNACFGKTLESQRTYRLIELVIDKTKVKKLIAKPQIEQFRIVNENTVLVDRVREQVKLDKPIYAGFAVLELSKLIMYDFLYNVMMKKYKKEHLRVCYSDTDSFVLHIMTDDIYKDFMSIKDAFLDTSGYPADHFLYSNLNSKVLGKFKDECCGQSPLEFVGTRSKIKSLLLRKMMNQRK